MILEKIYRFKCPACGEELTQTFKLLSPGEEKKTSRVGTLTLVE